MTENKNKKIMKTLRLLLLTKKARIALVAILVLFTLGIYLKLNYVAIVNGQLIQRSSYQNKLTQTNNFYSFSKQDSSLTAPVKNDTVDRLVDEQLVEKYAKDHKITVTGDAILSQYQVIFKGYNNRSNIKAEDDSHFLAKIKEMYGQSKNDYLEMVRMDLLKSKVQGAVKMPLAVWLETQKKTGIIKKF